jgi:hypothetical protein
MLNPELKRLVVAANGGYDRGRCMAIDWNMIVVLILGVAMLAWGIDGVKKRKKHSSLYFHASVAQIMAGVFALVGFLGYVCKSIAGALGH